MTPKKASFKFPRWILWVLIVTSIVIILTIPPIPSFVCQVNNIIEKSQYNKGKQSEGMTYVGSLNMGQQAYFTDHNRFGSSIEVLGTGIKTETNDYIYSTYIDSSRKTVKKLDYPHIAIQIGQSKKTERKSFIGAIWLSQVVGKNDHTTLSILCEANCPGTFIPPIPIIKGEGIIECAPETQQVGQ